MPKINIHQQEIGIQDVPAGPQADENITPKIADTSALGEALYKTGAATSDFANALLKSKVLADTAAAKSEFSSAMTEHLAAGKRLTDYNAIEKHKTVADEIRQGITAKYPLATGLEAYMKHGVRVANVELDNHGVGLVVQDIKAKNLAEVERLNKAIAFADPEQAEEYRIERDAWLDNIAEVSANKAVTEKLKEEGNIKAELYKYEEMIRIDPAAAKQMLLERNEDGTPVNVKYMGADLYGKLINEADQRERFNRNQWYQEENRAQHETLYETYKMMEDKTVPDHQKIAQIDMWMTPDATKGGMRMMDPSTGYRLKNAIKNGEHHTTDFATWQDLYMEGLPTPDSPTGTLTAGKIRAAQFSGKLSTQAAMQLTGMLTKQFDKNVTKEEKELDDDVKKRIGEFSGKINSMIGMDKSSDESKKVAGMVVWDAKQIGDRIKSKKDLEWFDKYLDESFKKAAENNTKKYLDKMSPRDSKWYDDYLGKTRDSQRRTNPAMAGTGVSVPTAHDPLVDQVFGKDAPTAKAIMRAESSGNPSATNTKNKNGTTDRGLFQINDVNVPALKAAGIIKSEHDLLDPATNTRAAKFLYDRDGWSPWNASKKNWDKSSSEWKPIGGKKIRRVG